MPSPIWRTVNAGLTSAQYQAINFCFVTPSGALYCGFSGGSRADPFTFPFFIARAPSIGGTFAVLYDVNNLWNGSGRWGISGAYYNPLQADTVGLIMTDSVNGGPHFWLGTGGTFVKKAQVHDTHFIFAINLSYGLGKWMATSYGQVRLLSPDGSSVTLAVNHGGLNPGHVRASTTGRTFHVRVGNGMFIGENNCGTLTEIADANLIIYDGGTQHQSLACDPSGTYMMTRYGPGNKGRSSDGGYTWVGIPNLPPGNWWFEYAGGTGSNSRWLAASGSAIKYSPDFGESWQNYEGNIASLIPYPNPNIVKAIAY